MPYRYSGSENTQNTAFTGHGQMARMITDHGELKNHFHTEGDIMRMNTRSRLAIAAIIDVAEHGANKPVSLIGVSKRQDISLSYLEQLFRKLRLRGIVSAVRGPGGGYRLTRQITTLTVADIVAAVDDDNFESCECQDGSAGSTCKSNGLWCRVNHHLHDFLSRVTIESILADSRSALSPAAMLAASVATRPVAIIRERADRMPA
jgi:Rrf2 family iron-sulfur cluster assembly transcriptional regulator